MLNVEALEVGDNIKHPRTGITLVVVRHEKNKVIVKKPEAHIKSVMSIDYTSPSFDDCVNRVEFVR